MSAKVATLSTLPAAERREAWERVARLELLAYKRAGGLTLEGLASEFACSRDSIERYLSGRRPVPGYIVAAIRPARAA